MKTIERVLAYSVGYACLRSGARLMLAESCTGGLASRWVTSIPGSSHWFDGGVVSYANAAKIALLGVSPATLASYGAVSHQVAAEMVTGLRKLQAEGLASSHPGPRLAASITGVAGPGGGSPEKPVGCVFFGWSDPKRIWTARYAFQGGRDDIQRQAAFCALSGLVSRLFRGSPGEGFAP